MKNAYLYRSSIVIKIALGIAISLIIYITIVFFNQMQNLEDSMKSMSAANKKLLEMEKILRAVSVNESSIRTFVLSQDTTYLTKRFYPRSELQPNIERLSVLSVRMPSESFNPDSLTVKLDNRFRLYDSVLASARSSNFQMNPELLAAIYKSDHASDDLRKYIYNSMESEVSNVNRFEISHKYDVQTSVITSFFLVTIALFILLISLSRINFDLKNLKRLNDDLRLLNHSFNSAEKIAGISHWKYNLKTKEYSFSENFYNLIGIDADSFEPEIKSILPFIHPDDREYVTEVYTSSINNRTPTSLIFRLLRPSGEMRYIKSIGSFAENSIGEILKIGVNYDITEQYENTVHLEDNNKRLTVINAELESFNNIVSHDLQEPLRKIQMFISRINDEDFEKMSDSGRQYFQRIAVSANRMQNLLMDLVNYSRTVKGDRAFVKSDLNQILKDVLAELALNIEEKKAEIKVQKLPALKVIPFQIHQLFINLLSNSLKFGKAEIPILIVIKAVKIKDVDVIGDVKLSQQDYFKLTLTDNGIGFRQEFAEKIFLLFRRLEKDNYEGTGIGLAICKKIIENHNGQIFAESTPGKGTKFTIYLPKKLKQ